MTTDPNDELTALLTQLIHQGAFPGGVLIAATPTRRLEAHAGHLSILEGAPAVQPATRYDLASVTKTYVSTATVCLIEAGTLSLDDRVRRFLPDFPPEKGALTLQQLLGHTGGVVSDASLGPRPADPEAMRSRAIEIPLEGEPGRQVSYSSMGYLFLGWILEKATGTRLDALLRELILEPLGCRRTGFTPDPAERTAIAATERPPGQEMVQGVVHDRVSRILGGITGHAGLFAPAGELLRYGTALLTGEGLGLGASRRLLFQDLTGGLDPNRSAAFVINDPVFTTFGTTTFSHTGFTGTSLCLVPERELVVVLLSNRVNPNRDNERIGPARTTVHQRVADLLSCHSRRRNREGCPGERNHGPDRNDGSNSHYSA